MGFPIPERVSSLSHRGISPILGRQTLVLPKDVPDVGAKKTHPWNHCNHIVCHKGLPLSDGKAILLPGSLEGIQVQRNELFLDGALIALSLRPLCLVSRGVEMYL
jgi:hypothetical protein